MSVHNVRRPYLLLIGDIENAVQAKTALGLRDWNPEACIGQMRFTTTAIDLGLPEMSAQQAVAVGAKTLVVGIAPVGGELPQSWYPAIIQALKAGLDVAAGLHQRLSRIPEIAECAAKLDRKIHDVRHSDMKFQVGSGLRRPGRRLLTVGTDCSLGKKYTALAITRALVRRHIKADFCATGQTGILISGRGIAVDAVVADFVAGAAEALSPANSPDHWDIIEGQGSLFHPAYSAVTLGLLHGSQPDALVLCHDPTRKSLAGFPHVPIVSIDDAIQAYVAAARLTNPAVRFVGISLNTSAMTNSDAERILASTHQSSGLPCIDPIRTGVEPIVNALQDFDARRSNN
jgi:uncharacterized NAD-dependent epimerase/dehydratase family protein